MGKRPRFGPAGSVSLVVGRRGRHPQRIARRGKRTRAVWPIVRAERHLWRPSSVTYGPGMADSTPLAGIRIRPIEAADAAELERFYAGLSDDSRRLRFFFFIRGLSSAQSTTFCSTDHAHREGFVATLGDGPSDVTRIVGHLCLEPDGDRRAEMAIAVADEFQRHSIGRRLMTAAIEWAQSTGVDTLTATMLTSNPGIHRLIAALGLPSRIRPSGMDTSTVEIAVPAVPAVAA